MILSIRLMTFNHEEYIEEALQSIDNQRTKFDFELVIGDDFSTDKTLNIIKSFKFKNPNLKLNILKRVKGDNYDLLRKENGRLQNFVDIINNCKGKYIALLDGDDYWTDTFKIQKQVDFLEKNDSYNLCFHEVKLFSQETNKFTKDNITLKVVNTTDILDLAKGNYIHTPSVVFRNNFKIPDWFKLTTMGDWTLYMILLKHNTKIHKINCEMAVYRLHAKSIWSNKTQEDRNAFTKKAVLLVYNNLKKELTKEVKVILKSRLEIKEFRIKKYLNKLFK